MSTTTTFSTQAGQLGLFGEYKDPTTGLPVRYLAGVTVHVRNSDTQVALPDTVTLDLGYIAVTVTVDSADDAVRSIDISFDGVTWAGPIHAREALQDAVNSGATSTEALVVAQGAAVTAGQAAANREPTVVQISPANGGGWPTRPTSDPYVSVRCVVLYDPDDEPITGPNPGQYVAMNPDVTPPIMGDYIELRTAS